MTPGEVWNTLKSAHKVAGAWTQEGATRVRLTHRGIVFRLWECGELYKEGLMRRHGITYDGKELIGDGYIERTADEWLRANGWLLIGGSSPLHDSRHERSET